MSAHDHRKKLKPHYDVTAGIIWRGEKILIAQRRHGDPLDGLWEFPGGRREQRETLKECLRREILEELGVTIRVNRHFMTVSHDYPQARITLHFFNCSLQEGQPQALDCHTWRWVRPLELPNFSFLPADRKAVEALKRIQNEKTRLES